MVFYINFPAEEEAGIRGGSATVTFDDGLTYDDVMVQGMKEFLSEWYDVKINNIGTEEERAERDLEDPPHYEKGESGKLDLGPVSSLKRLEAKVSTL